jgi:hypothetical protein
MVDLPAQSSPSSRTASGRGQPRAGRHQHKLTSGFPLALLGLFQDSQQAPARRLASASQGVAGGWARAHVAAVFDRGVGRSKSRSCLLAGGSQPRQEENSPHTAILFGLHHAHLPARRLPAERIQLDEQVRARRQLPCGRHARAGQPGNGRAPRIAPGWHSRQGRQGRLQVRGLPGRDVEVDAGCRRRERRPQPGQQLLQGAERAGAHHGVENLRDSIRGRHAAAGRGARARGQARRSDLAGHARRAAPGDSWRGIRTGGGGGGRRRGGRRQGEARAPPAAAAGRRAGRGGIRRGRGRALPPARARAGAHVAVHSEAPRQTDQDQGQGDHRAAPKSAKGQGGRGRRARGAAAHHGQGHVQPQGHRADSALGERPPQGHDATEAARVVTDRQPPVRHE